MPTVVLGVTGCIGAYKACEVLRELQRREVDVHVVMTEHATRFVSAMTFETLSRHPVFVDQFALGAESDIRHVSLADAAEVLLVAPATANVIGKFARGIADDALSTLYLATRAPLVLAPAMNVNMFEHAAVVENLSLLRARGARVVEPGSTMPTPRSRSAFMLATTAGCLYISTFMAGATSTRAVVAR